VKLSLKIILLFVIIVSFTNPANSVYKFLQVTEEKAYLFKYVNVKNDFITKIKNGSIKFSLKNNDKNTDFFCGEKWCFFINKWKKSITDKWFLKIEINSKIIQIPYQITFTKWKVFKIYNYSKIEDNVWIDISSKMKYKNIQKRSLSCEISATADILSYLTAREIKEDYLLKALPKSKYGKLPFYVKGQKYWWNPNAGFVWYIDKTPNWTKASQRKMTGYWVLEKPIEKIANKYWFKTKIITQFDYSPNFTNKEHLSKILEELNKWNMVQLWWDICTNPKFYSWKEHSCFYNWKPSWNSKRKISWNYINKDWKIVKYVWLNWEHAFYLLGYKWNINNPTHIIVWDTYTWKHTYKTEEWMRKWKKMQYRSIIIYSN